MKTKIFFLIAIFYSTLSMAQRPVPANIEGSPYLDDKYSNGVIDFGNSRQQVPVRYNVYQELMEYKLNGQLLLLDPSTSIKKVNLNSNTYVVDKVNQKDSKYSYLTVLDSGKATLLSKQVVVALEAKKGGALDGTDLPARYKRMPDVYLIKIGNAAPVKIESIKAMIELFPDKQEELTQFAKKEKISPRKESELIKFVKYYNSIAN